MLRTRFDLDPSTALPDANNSHSETSFICGQTKHASTKCEHSVTLTFVCFFRGGGGGSAAHIFIHDQSKHASA